MSALPDFDPDPILTVAEAATMLKFSEQVIRKWARDREIPAIRMGRDWRFRRSSLQAWVAGAEAAPLDGPFLARVPSRSQWKPDDEAYATALDRDPCCYCGAPTEAIDHIVANAARGEHAWTNFTAACKRCNSGKGARPLLWFLLHRRVAA